MKKIIRLLSLFFLVACAPSAQEIATPLIETTAVSQSTTTSPPKHTVTATIPPATNTAVSTPSPPPSSTPTPMSTVTPLPPVATPVSPIVSDPTIDTNGIQFTVDPTLAEKLYIETTDETDITTFRFDSEGLACAKGCIQFFKLPEYIETDGYNNASIEDEVAMTKAILAEGLTEPFPTSGAAIVFQSKTECLDFQSGIGVRAIVMRAQTTQILASSQATAYSFHGLTHDGNYYIHIMIPIDWLYLMDSGFPKQNSNENAIPAPSPPSPFPDDSSWFDAYNQEVASQMETAPTDEFTPNIDVLDALVKSLLVQPDNE